jgi:AmmeMemoRadiSam system protein B
MVRKPIVSGQFYADDFDELNTQIKESFNSKFGPGALPLKKRSKEILGIIAPHAGYMYSGPGAAWAYKEIAESKFADLYIMLGLSHSGFKTCISLEDWETPFGIVKTDKEFGKKLIKKGVLLNEEAHKHEHSIEVQLPFLQFANKDYLKQIKILPMIVSPDKPYDEIANMINDAIKESKLKVCIITSSDFTHFGFNYGYFPFNENIKENIYGLDKGAINYIKELNAYRFLDYTDQTGATICGKYPIAVALELSKLLGGKKAKLLHYYTSGDIIEDYGSAVGYASIIIE